VPVKPLLQGAETEYGMFRDFTDYPWVLPVHHYKNLEELLGSLNQNVIKPAEAKAVELQVAKQ
jgi:hypothetical protein